MRIAVYFHGYPAEKCGGHTFEQDILLSLCELARQCRHELVLFFENAPDDDKAALIAAKGLKAVLPEPQPGVSRVQRLVSKILGKFRPPVEHDAPLTLRAAMQREMVELIWFAADFYVPEGVVDAPYIATVWDIQHRIQPWFPEVGRAGMWKWRENFYNTFLRRAAYILTPNIVGQKELSLFYGIPPERFHLLPLPSPLIECVPNEEDVRIVLARYHLESGYLFYPAGFWPHKNHANLLLALQVLKNKYGQKKHLVLVGSDKGNLEYIRNLAKTLGLEEQVHFLGFVPRADIIVLYHGAFALTYLSLFGPENLPPLEAFQCGCPVVISDYAGARQQLGNAALFVNGLDPESIAKTIQELEIKPELRLALIERGRQRSVLYTSEDYIRDVFKIFDEFEPLRRTWGSSY